MIERTVTFGTAGELVGTLCLPQGARAAVGEVLFNAGVVHRIGPHRINVRLARALARRGVPSIRFDLAGLGDSARAGGAGYEAQAVADLGLAMDLLGREAGVERFALFGFCSGGVHSYAAAQADARIAGVILYDTYMYRTPRTLWNRYAASIRQKGWRGALGGFAARVARRAVRATREPTAQEITFSFRTPPREEFARTVRALHERGVDVAVMFSGGFRELYNYEAQFADAFRGTGIDAFVGCDYFADMDHNATALALQEQFIRRIEDRVAALDARLRASA